MGMKIQALFISDVHLGSKGSNATEVLEVLKMYQPEYLFLVGDIIDGWLLKRKFRWPQSHTNVIRKIMSHSKNGTKEMTQLMEEMMMMKFLVKVEVIKFLEKMEMIKFMVDMVVI